VNGFLICWWKLNVFNASLMNDAIFKFKRYEDSSLSYTGLDKLENEDVGGWGYRREAQGVRAAVL